MIQEFLSAIVQVSVVMFFCSIFFLIFKFTNGKGKFNESFLDFVGLKNKSFSWDLKFTLLFALILFLGIFNCILQYFFVDGFVKFTKSETSPYWKILKNGFDFKSILSALIYCILKAGLSEELLFRGLIAKRLIKNYGVFLG